MFIRLQAAPWWVLSLVQGVFFAAFTALFSYWLDADTSARQLVIRGVVVGGIYGLVMGRYQAGVNQQTLLSSGLDDPAEQRAASRAAAGGQVPSDPRLRLAAERLATRRLSELEGQRIPQLVILGALAIGTALGAAFSSPWQALFAMACSGLFVYCLILPGRLERRIDLLAHPEEYAPPSGPPSSST